MPATLEIRRDWPKDIRIRGLEVLLDDKPLDNLKYGDVKQVSIEPGPHRLKVTNTLYSKVADFTAAEGETVVFQAANKMPAACAWFLMMVSVAPYGVRLERIETEEDMFDEDGALTREFLIKRGECCGNKCRNCPYQWVNVPE